MPITAPTYPLGMTADKLLIANLMPIMPGDTVYFGFGRYASTTESDSAFTASAVANTLNNNYDLLGRLSIHSDSHLSLS